LAIEEKEMKRFYKYIVGPVTVAVKSSNDVLATAIAGSNPKIEAEIGDEPGGWLRDVADPTVFRWAPGEIFAEAA